MSIFGTDIQYSYPSQRPVHDARASAEGCAKDGQDCLWGDEGFSFKDLVDMVNPLQQIPVVGNIYRAVTGDTISAGSRMIGGALLGGPIGLVTSMISAGLDAATSGGETSVAEAAGKYTKTQNLG